MGFVVVLVLLAMVFGGAGLAVALVKWGLIAALVLFAAAAVSGYSGRIRASSS